MNPRHTSKVNRLFLGLLLAGATLFAVGAARVHANPPEQNEIAKLLPFPGIELGTFGTSVSIDGDTLVVGAPNYVPEPTGPGLVYIYNRDAQGNWTEHANLVVCDAACGDGFGGAVDIDGDTIIVGAAAAANSEITGAAYIFTRNEQGDWTQQAKLEVADPQITKLGGSVALEGNTAVVGMISTEIPEIFIFLRDQNGNWSHESTLTAPGTNSPNALAIQGDTIIVGAPFFGIDDDKQTTFGAVYIFTRDENGNWAQQEQLLDPNPEVPFNFFGSSIAFDSNTLVIGSLTFEVDRAYIFNRNEQGDWLMQQVLDPECNSSSDNFGASVAIQGDTLVVGASHDVPSGSAHIFTRDARGIWSEQAKLLQSDGGNNDNFGAAVAFDDDTIIVGARGDDDNGSSSGSAYVFDVVDATTTTPDEFNAFRGFIASGTLVDVLESDDSDLCHEPGIVLNPTEAPVTLDFVGTLPNDSPASLDVTIESSANTVGLELTFSFWNFNMNSWDVVGTDTQSLNNDTVRTFAGVPADHVQPGTGEVRTRYEVRVVSFIFLFPWLDCVDHVFWTTTS